MGASLAAVADDGYPRAPGPRLDIRFDINLHESLSRSIARDFAGP
jgi:hypothetical protein